MPNDPDKQSQWAAAARRGLEYEAERLRRDGPILGQYWRALAEALAEPGAEDVDFDPPKVGDEKPQRRYVTDDGEAVELDEAFMQDAKRGRP